jgi:Putative 2OG-Fe(II) oxygenase
MHDCDALNEALARAALSEERSGHAGLEVSNAGGAFHGQPHFLAGSKSSCQKELYNIIRITLECVECLYGSSADELALEADEMETWVNISRHGSWNRLHTHEGSAWSGVYYVQNPALHDDSYSGRLVLKPTTHPLEDTYQLSTREKTRLRPRVGCDLPQIDETAYLDIPPVPGSLILFPGWLHHCVLPSSMEERKGPRISIAFNVNWKDC